MRCFNGLGESNAKTAADFSNKRLKKVDKRLKFPRYAARESRAMRRAERGNHEGKPGKVQVRRRNDPVWRRIPQEFSSNPQGGLRANQVDSTKD
jgi:hypothetical protein